MKIKNNLILSLPILIGLNLINLNAQGLTQEEIKMSYYNSQDYEKQLEYSKAIKELSSIVKNYPNGYTINMRLAWLFYLNKNYANSKEYYQKAKMISKYSIEPLIGLSNIYYQLKNYKSLEQESNNILKIDYYNYTANYYLIKSLINMKKYDIAINTINKMLLITPLDLTMVDMLSKVYKLKGDKKISEEIKNNLLLIDKNFK
jgi:tetratricopeptide (TPR) repeat protein